MEIDPSVITSSNGATIGLYTILITLSISLAKIVEFLIKKALPQKKTLSEDEFDKLEDIYAVTETISKKNRRRT